MTSYLLAGPGEEPVTLAEAKAWCRIDAGDEDALVTALIAAARLHVESMTGRALIEQSWRLVLDGPKGRVVPLPLVPVMAVIAATADDAAIAVELQGDSVLLPAEGFRTLSIDYTAGYGGPTDVPQDLKQALLALVAFWFENRDATAHGAPMGFDRLIAGYRRVRL
ncbi:MAG: phage head-tail connector protein [Devosia nanyangense]|uniref:Phage head-tail connector protein n=1 Tax=Devosia nanyangense TaxID=1228055 RepID=A0A933L5B0_9HYPH|nr:phage head-tail connector protein [Devosia nanyangense]